MAGAGAVHLAPVSAATTGRIPVAGVQVGDAGRGTGVVEQPAKMSDANA